MPRFGPIDGCQHSTQYHSNDMINIAILLEKILCVHIFSTKLLSITALF